MTIPQLSLLQLSDPTLPIGGYAHSAGLETYVQQGTVHNAETAQVFIREMLRNNLFYTDGALLSLAFDAARNTDLTAIFALDEECTAVKLPKEIRVASQKLGTRLLKIFAPLCDNELSNSFARAQMAGTTPGHYCVVFGMLAAILSIPKKDALLGFYYNAAAGMVTNSVKLIPLGQLQGQNILYGLQALLEQLAGESLSPQRSLIGKSCPGFDVRSMQHEQLYSRLYMS